MCRSVVTDTAGAEAALCSAKASLRRWSNGDLIADKPAGERKGKCFRAEATAHKNVFSEAKINVSNLSRFMQMFP